MCKSLDVQEGTDEQARMAQERLCCFAEERKHVMGGESSRILEDMSLKPCQA